MKIIAERWLVAMALVLLGSGLAWGQDDPPEEATAEKPAEGASTDDEADEDDNGDRWLHVHNVDVYPVIGPVRRHAEILIKNGKIVAIGRDLETPEKVEVLDGMGFRAYPGLVALNGAGLFPRATGGMKNSLNPFGLQTIMGLAHGITTVISGSSAVKLQSGTNEDAVLREGLFEGLLYSSRNPRGKSQLRDEFRRARSHLRELGSTEAKPAAASAGGRGGPPPAANPKTKAAAPKKPNLGSAARLIPILEGKKAAVFNVSNAHDLLDVCELVEEFGFKAVVRGAIEGWTVASELGRSGVMAIVTPRVRQDPDRTTNRPTGSVMDNAAILYRHGVQIAISTSGSSVEMDGQPGKDALSVAWEAAAAVRGGLPDHAALESVTIVAARCYGIDDRVGSLEVGKDADIVICDGDILSYLTMPQWTIVNGRIVYDKEKEPLYRQVRSRDPSRTLPAQWWPRPFGEMPAEWAFDAKVAAEKKLAESEDKPKDDKGEEKPTEGDGAKPAEEKPAEEPVKEPAGKGR
ncbi:MAG: amidohydrolase family protein [Planctomycetes bacterium]|nr:amidohydrolase family protein [Planctomycetota bacterium]